MPPSAPSAPPADPDRHAGVHPGRAGGPTRIPLRGWRQALGRVASRLTADNLEIAAAGVAFHALLALMPALAATVSIYAVVARPSDVRDLMTGGLDLLPPNARGLVGDLLDNTVVSSSGSLTLAAAISLLIGLWSANRGMKAIVIAVNIAYGHDQSRGFIRHNLLGLSLTLGGIGIFVVAAFAIVALPPLLDAYRVGPAVAWTVAVARWPVLFGVFLVLVALIYRYAPARRPSRWRWVSPGAIAATVLWLLASGVLSVYTTYIADMGKAYGPIGGVVALLLWFYITAWVVLVGAELNAELERQTLPSVPRSATPAGPPPDPAT